MNPNDIEAVLRSYLTGDGYIASDDIPAICAAIEANRKRKGEVVVTKDESGAIVAVTRQDVEGHILSVIAVADRKRIEALDNVVRSSRSVDQLKEALQDRSQRFTASYSEVKNLIGFYEAALQCRGEQRVIGRIKLDGNRHPRAELSTGYDEIELPPLPTPDADHYDSGTFAPVWKKGKMEAYALAAIEAYRKRRGEPVTEITRRVYKNTDEHKQYLSARFDKKNGMENSFEGGGHRWAYRYTSFDDQGDYDLLYRPAPQPTEPDVLPGEAIFGFAAWLTSLKTPVTFSECHGAAVGADLAAAYNTSQGFDQVREDFHKRLKPYPKDEPPQPAEPVEKPYPVKLHAWGGVTRYHDYEMSDGSIQTLKDTEAREMVAGRNPAEQVTTDSAGYTLGPISDGGMDPRNEQSEPVKCIGCEGKPVPENNPCAVCGKVAEPVKVRPETDSEHIARDIREGRFPEKSDRKMVPAEPVKVPTKWSGWACQYPGKMPRLYGDKSIAMLNHHPEEGDRLLYLVEQSNPIPEPVKGPSDEDIIQLFVNMVQEDEIGRPVMDISMKEVIEVSRELLRRYGNAALPRPSDDELWDQTLRERDAAAEMADKLANAIAKHLGVEIGEHSSANHPWYRALDAIEATQPVEPVNPPTRDQIRDVFLSNGFTIKPGHTDLKEYVFKAAYELLSRYRSAAQPNEP